MLNEKGYPLYCRMCGKKIAYIEDKEIFRIMCGCRNRKFIINTPEVKKEGNVYRYSKKIFDEFEKDIKKIGTLGFSVYTPKERDKDV